MRDHRREMDDPRIAGRQQMMGQGGSFLRALPVFVPAFPQADKLGRQGACAASLLFEYQAPALFLEVLVRAVIGR